MDPSRALPDAGSAGSARSSDVVGVGREPAIDRLIELAARVCGTSAAGVSLVDGGREWSTGDLGLSGEQSSAVRTFTAMVLRSVDAVVIEDAAQDTRFCASPPCGAPPLRAFAGVPLHGIDGRAVGALFVADPGPRTFDDAQRSTLHGLARQAEHLLELQHALDAAVRSRDELARGQVRLLRILDAITQGVIVHAPDGSIEQANPAAQQILGVDFEQMRGRTPVDPRWETIHRDGTPFPGDQLPASVTLRDGTTVRDVTFGIARPDGERRWVLVNSAPVPTADDSGSGAVATFSDITDITELNDQLHASLRELAEAAQERAALLSAVSHDIRAPLASIRMMTEILEDRADAITTDQRTELIHRVRVEARRTEGVLADLVSANRVGTGLNTPRRQRVELDQLVRTVAREFANDDHEVRLGTVDEPLLLWADQAQIERILDNLISNAVRHTPAGSHVTVSAVDREDAIELSVSDDGPGVSDALKQRIFDAYVRGDRSENRPGSGLGLYLVQQFAQFHGGRAWCEDAPGGGARFVVSLPRRAPERA